VKKLEPADPLSYCSAVLVPDVVRTLSRNDPSLQFVGDAYFTPMRRLRDPAGGMELSLLSAHEALVRLTMGAAQRGELPLLAVLKEIATRGNTNVHLARDGWVRLRSTAYYEERRNPVDAQAVRELFGPLAEGQPYTPEVAGAITRRLSYAQAGRLARMDLGFLSTQLLRTFLDETYHGWQLFEALSPEHRRQLLAGHTLAFRSLDSKEQRAVRACLTAMSGVSRYGLLDLEIGPREFPACSLSLGAVANIPVSGFKVLGLGLPEMERPIERWSLRVQWTQEPREGGQCAGGDHHEPESGRCSP
jgi:hypothetical protein